MSDEPVKYLFSLSFDNFMGLNIVIVWKGGFYRWYWRRFWAIETMDLNNL